jgi:hypothetical protein
VASALVSRLAELTRDAKAIEIEGYYAPGGQGHDALTTAARAGNPALQTAPAAAPVLASAVRAPSTVDAVATARARESDRAVHTRPGIPVAVMRSLHTPAEGAKTVAASAACAYSTVTSDAPARDPAAAAATAAAAAAAAAAVAAPAEAAELCARVEAALALAAGDADARFAAAASAAVAAAAAAAAADATGGSAAEGGQGKEKAVPLPLFD